ncbi:arginine--tRNA ligase [Campylobacter sp. CLAX-22107-21]|uniref:arginine--tRNA ligase n=1 Tax=Campylobacter devanensis TaxID=3161138 RepID=UPI000A33B820|nr:arginine--tRNA ligase [Campylobacter sp. P0087]MEE3694862.1 arginine--tRNA ligase [Campylobacter sp. CLAX-22107-21]
MSAKDTLKNEISAILGREVVIEKPKDKTLAHYATPLAFGLAKELKKSPVAIAVQMAQQFSSPNYEVTAVNGYINFKLSGDFLDSLANDALKSGDKFGSKEITNPKNIFLEYISANPTGPLHIGHVRGAVYGDTLARVARHIGVGVHTEYYINDAGNQIDLLGISITLRAKEILFNETVEYPEKYYRGDYIDELAHKAYDKFGKEIFESSRNSELAEFAKDEVLKIIKKDLADAGIFIDNWASEKSYYDQLEQTLEQLEKSGQVYKKDGTTYIASSKLGDDSDRVVVRSDGRPTYLAGDIIYHNVKFANDFDTYINIWGADHHGYIARLKAAINFLGYDENKLEVILMQMVSLLKDGKPFKMSKRAGTSVLMSDILAEIGSDALRFIFISKAGNSSLEFDIDELKKQDSSNPIFYINYAHARVNQIFAKANKTPADVANASLTNLSDDGKNLLFEALTMPEVLEDALNQRSLHKIPDYLKSLSASFHKFYNENRVVGSQNEDELLKLFSVVALSIKVALNLMGIKAKDIMEN